MHDSTVEPRYNEVLGTMKITLLYQVSHYIRVKKQRNIKSWDQQNYLVITGFCYIRPLIMRFHCTIHLYIVNSYSAMDGCTAINFVNRQNCFCPVGVVIRCMMAFAGAFTTKQQFMHPHCIVYHDKTWKKTSFDMLWKSIAEQPSWPIWTTNVPYERK